MSDAEKRDSRSWERGWDGHAEAQRSRLARLTLPEKLQWLEQAQQVINHLHGQSPDGTPDRLGGGRPATSS